jgi:hypothetical protein
MREAPAALRSQKRVAVVHKVISSWRACENGTVVPVHGDGKGFELGFTSVRRDAKPHCFTTVVLPSVHGSPLSAPSTQKKCRMSPGTNKAAYPSMTVKNHASPLRNCPL